MDYKALNRANRQTDEKRVKIEEINTAQRYITAIDAIGGTIRVIFDLFPSVVDVPEPGDTWVVVRSGLDWRLVRRLENGTEQTTVESLSAGDKRLEASENLHLNGQRVVFNGLYLLVGKGSPEGVEVAPIGSLYLRKDGAANTVLYVKESGSGNTGWVSK